MHKMPGVTHLWILPNTQGILTHFLEQVLLIFLNITKNICTRKRNLPVEGNKLELLKYGAYRLFQTLLCAPTEKLKNNVSLPLVYLTDLCIQPSCGKSFFVCGRAISSNRQTKALASIIFLVLLCVYSFEGRKLTLLANTKIPVGTMDIVSVILFL